MMIGFFCPVSEMAFGEAGIAFARAQEIKAGHNSEELWHEVMIDAGKEEGRFAQSSPVLIDSGQPGFLRAVIKAQKQAVLSSQLAARIMKIGPEEGERFEKGRILVQFDCDDFQAQMDKAEAELMAARERYSNAEQLDRMGGISRLEVTVAEAQTQMAEADVKASSWKLQQCIIRAPYDGRVVERIANIYESVTVGDDMMLIVSDADLEVRVIVPSVWLRKIGIGSSFSFTLEETGETYDAEVVALGARIDPVSQTLEIRGRILSSDKNVIAGMSGNALFADFADMIP